MKKLFVLAALASVSAAFAEEVKIGEIGVTAVTCSGKNTIVALSYEDMAGGQITADKIVKTTNLAEGDQLMVWNGNQYSTWRLNANKEWVAPSQVVVYKSPNDVEQHPGFSANEVTSAVGTGFWLIQENPVSTIYIYGKPATSLTSTTVGGKWTLIGNPTQAAIDIIEKLGDNCKANDQIALAGVGGNLVYYTYTGKYWRSLTEKVTELQLGAGLGCWIKTVDDRNIDWQ